MDQNTEALCLELARQPDQASQKVLLERFPEYIDMQLVTQLAEAVRAAVRVDVQRAMGLAEAALAIARELKTDEALALAMRARANADWFTGECKSAVHLFQEAATLFERAGNQSEVARTLSSSIQSLALLGEYDKAFAAAARARHIFTSLGEDWRLARVDINVANIYHRQNRYTEALEAYEAAYQRLLPHRDMEGIGVALHNMAVCLIALDDFQGALETYGRVREFCSQHEMPLLVSQADYNIAYLYYLRGDYTKALLLLRSTRETCRKNGDTYHLGLCDLDQSEIYLELSLVEEAAEMAQNSVTHFTLLGMGFESARSLTNLAIAVSLQGDARRALSLFARAKEITQGENNQVWPNLIDLYCALVLLDHREFSQARDLCLSAGAFFRSVHMPSKHVLCLLLLTRVYLGTGELDRALLTCNDALEILRNLDSPLLFYQAQFWRGRIYEELQQPGDAYSAYNESRSALETLRSSLQRQELKIGFMRNRLEVYARLVQLCLDRNSSEACAEEALSYIEAAKARTLQDLILNGPQSAANLPAESEADRRVATLRKELNWYYHRIEREQLSQDKISHESVVALKQQVKEREHQLSWLLLEAPESASIGLALRNSNTASLAEIRGALDPETALLEYFAMGERVHVAVLTKEILRIVPLASIGGLTQRLRMLQFQFSKFRLDSEYIAKFQQTMMLATQEHLHALYSEVMAPVERLPGIRSLVIVPFGPLHSLPFHALFDGSEYLADRFTICYAPSASIFSHIQGQPEISKGRALILGVDDPRMPFIKDELEAVAAAVPEPKVLFGAAANERALREYGAASRIVHIATHGFFRQDSPMFSSIKLADSYLNLYDLYHMNLPVDLLTLSGCVTGLNVVAEGDELLGLTRGLLYSGARSLLLSLWDVDDRSTADFMKKFYSQLGQHTRKADALRAAMIELREQYPHPYYWAPFKLIGKALG
jgi:CHAT domain-containing protein